MFTNNTSAPVCAIRVAPSVSRYFEVYVYTASPIAPGGSVTVPIADVGQDVETVGCRAGDDDGAIATFSFDPHAGRAAAAQAIAASAARDRAAIQPAPWRSCVASPMCSSSTARSVRPSTAAASPAKWAAAPR